MLYDFDNDEDDYNEMYLEDDWEDAEFEKSVNDQYPGWKLVKMPSFTHSTFIKVEPWLAENVKYGEWKKVGWSSGCSYSVGVIFESGRDAMMFKLRWR